MPKINLKLHDLVKVRGCRGTARIESYSRKYGVYFLDRQMLRLHSNGDGETVGFSYWSFEPKDLTKVTH